MSNSKELCSFITLESFKQEERVLKSRLRKRWRERGMTEPYKNLKACEQALCNDYLKTASIPEAARRSEGNFNIPQAEKFLKSEKAINYLTVMRDTMNMGVESTYKWKLKKLKTGIESIIGDDTDSVDKRHLGSAFAGINIMNKMEGHEAPTSTVVLNIDQDHYIKQVNVVAQRIMAEEKNKELGYDGDDENE